jgi:hypothetical protein
MNNFRKSIEELTERELVDSVNAAQPEYGQIAMGELTRRSMNQLRTSIDSLNKSTGIYSKVIIVLTVFLVILAVEQELITIFPPQGAWILTYVLPLIALPLFAVWIADKSLNTK